MKRQIEGGRKGEETVREGERRKRRVSYPSPAHPVLLLLARLFLRASLFHSFEIYRVQRREERRRREEREERRDRDTERETGEENGKVLSFFWMSQAQVRRRGRTNRKPGSGRKKKR